MKLRTLLILATTLSLSIVSCQKDDDGQVDTQGDAIKLSIANSASSAAYDDVFDVVLQEGENNGLGRTSTCATVTVNPTGAGVFPKTLTIDFGTGCTSATGVTRKGKVIAVFSDYVHVTGATMAVSFENYYV